MTELSQAAAAEYWIKALGISDFSGLQAATPRLLVPGDDLLLKRDFNISEFPSGEAFRAALFPKPQPLTPICLCFCKPGSEVRTDIRQAGEAPGEDGDPTPRHRDIAKSTDIIYVIAANLLNDGSIVPRRDGLPMIARSHLEPETEYPAYPLVGDWMAYVDEMASFGFRPDKSSMSAFWKAAMRMFAAVAGRTESAQQEFMGELRLLLVPTRAGTATRSLATVYAALGTALPGDVPLIGRLLDPKPLAISSVLGAEQAAAARLRHIAMVDRRKDGIPALFPLDPSQRRALHNLLEIGDRDGLVAVSGPPGTGKTDMLRAVIANCWTAAAAAAYYCPVILVCGATRQSVRNVMGAFDGSTRTLDEDPLKARWIEGLGGYAAIFPAASRLEEDSLSYQTVAKDFLEAENGRKRAEVAFRGRAEDVGRLGRSDLPRLAVFFLACMSKAFPDTAPHFDAVSTEQQACDAVEAAAVFLRAELRHDMARLEDGRRFLDDGFDTLTSADLFAWHGDAGSRDPGWSNALLAWDARHAGNTDRWEVIEGVLDIALRWRAFHLAARYWEAVWLCWIPARDALGAMKRPGLTAADQLKRLSMLTPCLVSTLHSAPRLVEMYDIEARASRPGWRQVDLLVIDEAGQAAPELGAAVLALASRAVVVGDVKQLAPITQMVPALEEPAAAACGVSLDALRALRLDSGTSSVMSLATRAGSCRDPGGSGGVRLRNHYRCYPTIINFCLALKYGDRDELGAELVPKLRDPRFAEWQAFEKGAYPLPPMAFVQGGSPLDEPEGVGTKRNLGEARRLVDWIGENGPRLAAWHRAEQASGGVSNQIELENLIKVITPFRGQVEAILAQLARFDDAADPDLRGIAGRLKVGTVHTMQGAEAPVVLFSAVNRAGAATRRSDPASEQVFVDRDGGNLLNVAVSRAQKSFVLFGHSDLFFAPASLEPENDLPSALLGRYLAGEEARQGYGVKLGPHSLVVVESVAKAKIIGEALGTGYLVFGTNGHFRELDSLDLDRNLTPVWTLGREAEARERRIALLRKVGSRLLQTRNLVLATDADREGEAIAWHFLQTLKSHPWWEHVRTVSRVTFESLEGDEIRSSFSNPIRSVSLAVQDAEACLDLGAAHSALARALVDADLGALYQREHGIATGRIAAPLTRLLAANLAHQTVRNGGKHWTLDVVLRGDALDRERDAILVRWTGEGIGETMRFANRYPQKPGGPSAQGVAAKIHGSTATLVRSLPPRLVSVAPPSGTRTAGVLSKAWRRHCIPPHRTMQLLQQLYEIRETDTPLEHGPAQANPLARPCDGRLSPTDRGKELAGRLASPSLGTISDITFAAEVEKALEAVAVDPVSYRHALLRVARKIREETGSLATIADLVSPPSGCFLEAETLWAGFPTYGDGLVLWAGGEQAAARWIAEHGNRAPGKPEAGHQSGGSYSPQDAHPSLSPLTLWGAPENLPRGWSNELRNVYAVVWGELAASVLRPAHLRLTTLVFRIEGLSSYELTLDMAEVIEAGYTSADPGLRADLLRSHLSPTELRRLRGGAHLQVHVHGEPTHEDLPRLTPDGLLSAMMGLRLGRPSTYGDHLKAFIG